MFKGIAVDFGCAGLKNSGLVAFGHAEHVDGAEDIGLDGADRVVLVVDGRCGAGEIVDAIDLIVIEVDRIDDVVLDESEMGMREKVSDVLAFAGKEIVDAEDAMVVNESVTEMTAQEAGSSGYGDGFHFVV